MTLIYVLIILYIILLIPTQIGWGYIYKKMGLNFYIGLIPFYNKIKLINHYKIPEYDIVLVFVPILSLYTDYLIYKNICAQYKKEFLYVIELTFFPFVYNFFLAFDIKNKPKEKVENYFEDQKNIYNIKEEEERKKIIDEYTYKPKKIKYDGVYKATRNNLNAKININVEKNNEIINNKKTKEKNNTKICPNCGAQIKENTKICYICGTKL